MHFFPSYCACINSEKKYDLPQSYTINSGCETCLPENRRERVPPRFKKRQYNNNILAGRILTFTAAALGGLYSRVLRIVSPLHMHMHSHAWKLVLSSERRHDIAAPARRNRTYMHRVGAVLLHRNTYTRLCNIIMQSLEPGLRPIRIACYRIQTERDRKVLRTEKLYSFTNISYNVRNLTYYMFILLLCYAYPDG